VTDDLKVALLCDEYAKQARIFRNNPGLDAVRAASNGMTESRRAIEGEVDAALEIIRHPEYKDYPELTTGRCNLALRTVGYFCTWLARRGSWE
jgi:hypothetical protein